ncbi:glycosyltransferase family 4 protein [Corynebacterium sp. TAE3-ERU16]|uniref:glycosyltransferase family 4 protein n=1 Tax=Corynebacterium sp. TAE3-ERU16 TaxID=2849493 RepID=UPI001C484394|nr:glycosyltransferase family 4 protein [Corynebacterium sp. TAE3-ERU16]MBV7294233.1 glycosyltransferase family 4 protein [Corynebacterium sp. TAE3-ERU16]
MHILLITQYWEPEQGVVQRRWQWISEALIEAGHELTVVCPPPHYPSGHLISSEPRHQTGSIDQTSEGIRVYRTAFLGHGTSLVSRILDQGRIMLSQMWIARRAARDAKKEGRPFSLVCCTIPALPSSIVAFTLSRILRKPLVVELRDAWPEILEYLDEWKDRPTQETATPRKLKVSALHFGLVQFGRILNFILKYSNTIITTTESLADLKRTQVRGSVFTVRNRPNIMKPITLATDCRKDGPLRILYAGTVGRAQGMENAMRALQIAVNEGTEIEMRIIGDGAHLDRVQKIAKSEKLPVEFLGRIPFSEVGQHYQWADTVLVHLQSWKPMEYTIPSKLFEGMRAEKHITAALAGEAANIVKQAQIGDVVQPMNPQALARLWISLASNRQKLHVHGRGADWFEQDLGEDELKKLWLRAAETACRKPKRR